MFVPVRLRLPRNFQAWITGNTVNSPKKTPVNSSHSTPLSRKNGLQAVSPNRRPPRTRPSFVARICCNVGALRAGVTGAVEVLGEAAASAAMKTAFATPRAPIPSARPNRTVSIRGSVPSSVVPFHTPKGTLRLTDASYSVRDALRRKSSLEKDSAYRWWGMRRRCWFSRARYQARRSCRRAGRSAGNCLVRPSHSSLITPGAS